MSTAYLTLFDQGLNALDNKARLILFIHCGVQLNELAFIAFGPEMFAHAVFVTRYERIGCFQNHGGGTVILFQAQSARAREILAEALQVLDFRTTPAVDRLVIVTDDSDIRPRARQHPQPGVLDGVGVLKLVDQDMLETLLVMFQQFRVL